MDESINLFISYAHKDERMKIEFEKYLSSLKRSRKINVWSDGLLRVGDNFAETIGKELQQADIILPLISADYLASEYIWEKEFAIAIERHSSGSALVTI